MILSTRIKRLVRLTMPLHDCLLASTWNMNILMLWFITISFMNIPQCNFLNILSNVYLIRTILHHSHTFKEIILGQIYFCISYTTLPKIQWFLNSIWGIFEIYWSIYLITIVWWYVRYKWRIFTSLNTRYIAFSYIWWIISTWPHAAMHVDI